MDGNKCEHVCFKECDTAHVAISVAEETGFLRNVPIYVPNFLAFRVNFGFILHYFVHVLQRMQGRVIS